MVTPTGERVAHLGDPELDTFLRSTAKPIQALPLVLAGGVEHYALSQGDLALICASHSGTPAHTERAAALLAKGGFSVDDLQCGAHYPFHRPSAQDLRCAGEEPTPLHNNCSGKHAGMLLACRLLDFPTDSYLENDHPLQRLILERIVECCGVPAESLGVGIDGCSLPSFHAPLAALAGAYARLADPTAAGLEEEVVGAVDKIVDAMTSAPEMVACEGEFTTRLMQVTGGRILGKEGAEGAYAVAIRGPVAMGIAAKIADGGTRAREGVVIEILRQLGSLSGLEFEELADFYHRRLKNCRGLEVGEVVPDLELEEG